MNKPEQENDFERLSEEKDLGFIQECWQFIVENRNWWLIPMLIMLGIAGLLIILSATGAGPFIYALF